MKISFLSAAFAACAALPAFAADITAKSPYAFSTAKTAKAGGAYVSVVNSGPADRLIGAKADIAKRVEIHQHIKDGDIMRMRPVEGLRFE